MILKILMKRCETVHVYMYMSLSIRRAAAAQRYAHVSCKRPDQILLTNRVM